MTVRPLRQLDLLLNDGLLHLLCSRLAASFCFRALNQLGVILRIHVHGRGFAEQPFRAPYHNPSPLLRQTTILQLKALWDLSPLRTILHLSICHH